MTKNTLPKWDLSDLYKSITAPELQDDIKNLQTQANEFANNYKGKQVTEKSIQDYEAIRELTDKIISYAQLQFATQRDNEQITKFYQDTNELINKIESITLFFTLSINKLSDGEYYQLLTNLSIAKYKTWLDGNRVFKAHQLDEATEVYSNEKSITSNNAWVNLFDKTMASLRFNYDAKQLTEAEIFNKYADKNAATRQKAAQSLIITFGDNIELFTHITNSLAKDKAIEDSFRKLPNSISARNKINFIEDEVVDNLISTVKANYKNLSHRYYKLKAKWLGKAQLDFWDRNAPLPQEDDTYIEYDQAVDLVLNAYNKFSPTIADIGKKFFDNAWVDVPPYKGKDSGAFAHPTATTAHPYLLLNYQGKIRDVMTLAHELGHGVHQYLSRSQGALMADTPLTLAETASVFGEQLTFRAILDNATPANKKAIIANKVEDMLNTVVRQIAFCEFETQLHNIRKQGELSSGDINKIWLSTQSDALGDAIKLNNGYQYFWCYIPHFIHTPFYVYAYAFGDCLVNSLYSRYLQGIEGFEDKYINMLKAGGSLHHKELLAPFNINITSTDFWQDGLNMISGFIDELENLPN